MIAIYLDGQALDTAQDTSIGLTVSVTNVTEVGSTKGAYTKSIKIPATQHNRALFGYADEILSAEAFNNADHTARIEQDGVELVAGKAYLDSVELSATDDYFSMQIVGNDFGWAQAIRDKKMNAVSADKTFSKFARYALQTEEERANAFFALIDHGAWWQEVDEDTRTDGANKIRRSWATQADLVPFVNVYAIVQALFSGYKVSASRGILDTLARLFVTGAYNNQDPNGVLADDNDFEITSEGMENAPEPTSEDDDAEIAVKITPADIEPIELPVLTTIAEDKHKRITLTGDKEAHNLLAKFTPSEDCVAQFRVRGVYRTTLGWGLTNRRDGKAYEMAWATLATPTFANRVYINGEALNEYRITDSKEWAERIQITGNGTEADVEFIHTGEKFNDDDYIADWKNVASPSQMCLLYAELSNPEKFTEAGYLIVYDGYDVAGAKAIPTTRAIQAKMFFVGCQLMEHAIAGSNGRHITILPYFRGTNGTVYSLRQFKQYLKTAVGDIIRQRVSATSDGYFRPVDNLNKTNPHTGDPDPTLGTAKIWGVSEDLRLTFGSERLPSPTFRLSKDIATPLWLGVSCTNAGEMSTSCADFITTTGAESLTVYGTTDCSITPKFGTIPPVFGTRISLNDIAGDTDAPTFLKALLQLFNLRPLTNPDTKRVTLVAGDVFYTDDIVDWGDRVDALKDITVETLCEEVGSKYTLAYQGNSPAVEEYNDRHTRTYGSYSYDLPTKAESKETENENGVLNPSLFTDARDIFEAQAEEAPLLNLHAQGAENTIEDVEFEWARSIVKRTENKTITVNTIGVIADYLQPRLSFAEDGDDATLTFHSTAGTSTEVIGGLHKYYDTYAQMYRTGKRITCYCRVEPQEVEAIRKYGTHPTLNFRSRYKIRIKGEELLCRLESIDNYEPNNASHKCTFIYFIER